MNLEKAKEKRGELEVEYEKAIKTLNFVTGRKANLPGIQEIKTTIHGNGHLEGRLKETRNGMIVNLLAGPLIEVLDCLYENGKLIVEMELPKGDTTMSLHEYTFQIPGDLNELEVWQY